MLLPDGVTRERAITVLKWLAKGRDTRMTAELSGETRQTVADLLDLCPDPSPRGIRMLVDELERGARSRPEPIRGPVPPLTPATPRVIEHVRLHSLAVTMDGNGIEVIGPAFTEPAPDVEQELRDDITARLVEAYTEKSEQLVDQLVGDLDGWQPRGLSPLAHVVQQAEADAHEAEVRQAADDVDRLVERVQAFRPPDPDPAAARAPAPADTSTTCALCGRPVTYPRGTAKAALTDHYTTEHADELAGRR